MYRYGTITLNFIVLLFVMSTPAVANNVNLLPCGNFETCDFSGCDFADLNNTNPAHGVDLLNPCSNDLAYHFDVGAPTIPTRILGSYMSMGFCCLMQILIFFRRDLY